MKIRIALIMGVSLVVIVQYQILMHHWREQVRKMAVSRIELVKDSQEIQVRLMDFMRQDFKISLKAQPGRAWTLNRLDGQVIPHNSYKK